MRDLLLANTILTTKVATISETSKYVESHEKKMIVATFAESLCPKGLLTTH